MTNSALLSNAGFLVPFAFFVERGMLLSSLLTLAVFAFSSLYHDRRGHEWRALDMVAAWGLIAHNGVLLALSDFKQPFAWLAVGFLATGVYFFHIRGRDDWEWHLSSAAVTLCCALAFFAH